MTEFAYLCVNLTEDVNQFYFPSKFALQGSTYLVITLHQLTIKNKLIVSTVDKVYLVERRTSQHLTWVEVKYPESLTHEARILLIIPLTRANHFGSFFTSPYIHLWALIS